MRVREANITDAAAIARVHVDTWRSTYRGIVPDEVLDGLSYEVSEAKTLTRLADFQSGAFYVVAETDDREVIGFAVGGPERGNCEGFDGELWAIYVLKEYQRMGVGRMLVRAVVERLINAGFKSMAVWVFTQNSSRAFYEGLGGRFIRSQILEIGGRGCEESAYGWEDIGTLHAALQV